MRAVVSDGRSAHTHRYFIGGRYRGAKTRLARRALDAAGPESKLRKVDERQQNDGRKLEQMMLYAQGAACRWEFLLDNFDEPTALDRCGTCDNCVHPPDASNAPPSSTPLVQ